MKENFRKIQFLVYAVVVFIVAFALDSSISGKAGGSNNESDQGKPITLDTVRIERVLHAKERRMDSVLSMVRDEVRSGRSIIQANSIFVINNSELQTIGKEGLQVLVFHNDTLRYWTDNRVPCGVVFNPALNNRLEKLNNAWYEIRTITDGGYKYVGLIFLKNKYDKITNRLLPEDLMPEFELPSAWTVAPINVSFGVPIKDCDGTMLFSLLPVTTVYLNGSNFYIVGVLFLAALILLMLFFNSWIQRLMGQEGKSQWILLIILGLMFACVELNVLRPSIIYNLDFFDTDYFRGGGMVFTIGDFVINSVFLFFVIKFLFMLAEYRGLRDRILGLSPWRRYMVWALMLALFFGGFGYIFHEVQSLVRISKFSFMLNNLMAINAFSIVGLLLMVILSGTMVFTSIKMASYFDYTLVSGSMVRHILVYLSASLAISLMLWPLLGLMPALAVLYAFLMLGVALHMHYHGDLRGLFRYMVMLLLSAMFEGLFVCYTTESKIDDEFNEMASMSTDIGDPIAELLINGFSGALADDPMLYDYVSIDDPDQRQAKLHDYILHQYFSNAYWIRYDIDVRVLEPPVGVFFAGISDDFVAAYNSGLDTKCPSFRLIDTPDGSISYYGYLDHKVDGANKYICISVRTKAVPKEVGYPSLLISDNAVDDRKASLSEQEYARYHNGQKMYQNGSFSYDMSDKSFVEMFSADDPSDTLRTMDDGPYKHIVHHKDGNTMVITRQKFTFADYVTQFSYLFVTFMLMMFLFANVILREPGNTRKESLQSRLIVWFSIILVLSFVFVCIASVSLVVNRFRNQDAAKIDERVSSVYMRINQECGDTLRFNTMWKPGVVGPMDICLTKMSQVFFTDINLYGANGQLIATSRPELFADGFISTRINSQALSSFMVDYKASFIQEENIGKVDYASAYTPFFNKRKEIIGYINMPYFSNVESLERELSNQIVSIINLYVVLMMLTILLAALLSSRIVQPIKMIQNKMVTMELGKNHEKIAYDRDDEIGQLVAEYNTMVDKLAESAKLIAQGEREEAWKTMARQVAHEIKNPLTPMQLSTQFLKRAWDDQKPDFGERIAKFTDTMIQQIETLSSIATSFSNFAKMPDPVCRPLNLVEILSNVVTLYQNDDKADVTSDLGANPEIICMLDKEQISRVFVNIIKNATQAIPNGVRGKIHVTLKEEADSKVVVRIADNGSGIPDAVRGKIFTPNFTTKSTGSGLGLAMVKTMVENVKGSITFESEVGKGTTFIITLPVGEYETDAVS